MSDTHPPSVSELEQAVVQLDACERLVEKLHKLCCEPDRSPRMERILADIRTARQRIDAVGDTGSADPVIEILEVIGAQVGHLQVACCTPARMPLYADTLSGLATTQIHISHHVGQGH